MIYLKVVKLLQTFYFIISLKVISFTVETFTKIGWLGVLKLWVWEFSFCLTCLSLKLLIWMKITEKNPVKLPRGFHFAGQPAHIFNEKISRRVRLEFEKSTRAEIYHDMYVMLESGSTSLQCMCICGDVITLQYNGNGMWNSYWIEECNHFHLRRKH
jgi:hypothetical protein